MVHQWGFFGSISAIRKIWSLTANSRSLQAAALKMSYHLLFNSRVTFDLLPTVPSDSTPKPHYICHNMAAEQLKASIYCSSKLKTKQKNILCAALSLAPKAYKPRLLLICVVICLTLPKKCLFV